MAEPIVDGPGWRIRFRELGSREGADTLRGLYLEAPVRPEEDLARGTYYWHEGIGTTVRGVDGTELGTVQDIYRVAANEVFAESGGSYGSCDGHRVADVARTRAARPAEALT